VAWEEWASRAAAAYASGGASEAARSSGGGGAGGAGMTDGNRFGPVIVGTGFSKIAASLSAPVGGGDMLAGVTPAGQLMSIMDGDAVTLGGHRIPWAYIAVGLGVVWLIKSRKTKS